jgi:hypothetical protein
VKTAAIILAIAGGMFLGLSWLVPHLWPHMFR